MIDKNQKAYLAAFGSTVYWKRSQTTAVATTGRLPKALWSITLIVRGGINMSSLGNS